MEGIFSITSFIEEHLMVKGGKRVNFRISMGIKEIKALIGWTLDRSLHGHFCHLALLWDCRTGSKALVNEKTNKQTLIRMGGRWGWQGINQPYDINLKRAEIFTQGQREMV